ncbi:MAG: hypothetical protein WCD11_09555, partial [Solirubrobacteraceae bacterium]
HRTDCVRRRASGGEARDQAGDARRICELDQRFDRGAGRSVLGTRRQSSRQRDQATATIMTFVSLFE